MQWIIPSVYAYSSSSYSKYIHYEAIVMAIIKLIKSYTMATSYICMFDR